MKINNFDCYWNYHEWKSGFSFALNARSASRINVGQKKGNFLCFALCSSNLYLTTYFYFYPRWTFDTRVSSYQRNWHYLKNTEYKFISKTRSSVAATFIATLVLMMEESVTGGCSDSEQTRAMITSLWFISENIAGKTSSEM